MLCGNFSESRGKKLKLNDVDGNIFVKVLDVWCGREDCQELALAELPLLASVADRFQMTEVTSVLEEAAAHGRAAACPHRPRPRRDHPAAHRL